MADHVDRLVSSYVDVVAVEYNAPGMVRVVTVSDAYIVDCRQEVCSCPDFEYNLDGEGRCKHINAALRETDQLPTPTVFGYDESLTTRPDDQLEDDSAQPDRPTEAEAEAVTDGGQSFDGFEFGDQLEYVGPEEVPGDNTTPKDRRAPFEFRHVSMHGTLTVETKHNAPRHYAPDHPVNNPEYWSVVSADGGCQCDLCASDTGPGCYKPLLD